MGRAVSIIVPLLNEQESLVELHRQLDALAEREAYDLQLIFVDDGSTDASWERILQIGTEDSRVEAVRFRRNFGKAAALNAGFELATAPVVVTMDADLQDDPTEVPKLIAQLDGEAGGERFDVASGWKTNRQDPWHKTLPSLAFNTLVSRLTKVRLHDHNCGLKAYRREAIAEVQLYGELHRFIPVLVAARGFRVTEVPVHHRAREHGVSKYGVTRLVKGLLDLVTVKFLTGYGDRPQHLLGGFGLLTFSIGSLGLFYLAVRWVSSRLLPGLDPVHLHQTASLFYSLAFCMVGAQFLSVGLLAAMFAAHRSENRHPYCIAESFPEQDAAKLRRTTMGDEDPRTAREAS